MRRSVHMFRVTAALFALVLGVSPVASSLHADDHAHVYCAEHQALEESRSAPAVSARSSSVSAPAAFDFARAEREEHEACPFVALTVRSATAVEAEQDIRARLLDARVVGAVDGRGFDVFAVLFTAPKASPPEA